LLGCSPRDWLY